MGKDGVFGNIFLFLFYCKFSFKSFLLTKSSIFERRILIYPCEEANFHFFNPTQLSFFSRWRLEVEDRGWCCDGRLSMSGRSSCGSSKGSKLVIRRSKGSKLPGCNFHSQIYDLASRGLYSIETTPLTSPTKGYCKSHPSYPQRHHTLSLTHTHTRVLAQTPLLTFHFLFSLVCYTCLLCFLSDNPLPSTSSCFSLCCFFLWSH